jgi:FdhD protein
VSVGQSTQTVTLSTHRWPHWDTWVRGPSGAYVSFMTDEAASEAALATAELRPPGPVTRVRALRIEPGPTQRFEREEHLATEEPLEIRVGDRRLAVTMRTPGADFELAVGWLHAEGVVTSQGDVTAVRYCTDVVLEPDERFNVVTVDLADPLAGAALAARSFIVSSACGVCGRDTLDDLRDRGYEPAPAGAPLDPELLAGLPDRLRDRQAVFERTGGLHAAGLFDAVSGDLLVVREDVGRHNAVDKVVGWALLGGRLPLSGAVLVVSGRTSYELCQKAVAAGVPALVSVSAPSSLAVGLARTFGLTLAGFARDGRVTVYAGRERLAAR